MKEITSIDGRTFVRLSKWLNLKTNYHPCRRNPLWDYACDENGYHPFQEKFNPANGVTLDYFTFRGKDYALEEFYVLGSVWITAQPIMYLDEDGKLGVIGTVCMDGDIYHPYYGEWDEYCERVRIYEEKR